VKIPQKSSNGASLVEEKTCLICPERINQPEMGLERLIDLSTMSDRSTTMVGTSHLREEHGGKTDPRVRFLVK
jgi:alanine dehydrogenase